MHKSIDDHRGSCQLLWAEELRSSPGDNAGARLLRRNADRSQVGGLSKGSMYACAREAAEGSPGAVSDQFRSIQEQPRNSSGAISKGQPENAHEQPGNYPGAA